MQIKSTIAQPINLLQKTFCLIAMTLSILATQYTIFCQPLPTLALDQASIAGCIGILIEYLKRLGIEDVAIINKQLIFKEDFLTVRNVTRAIH